VSDPQVQARLPPAVLKEVPEVRNLDSVKVRVLPDIPVASYNPVLSEIGAEEREKEGERERWEKQKREKEEAEAKENQLEIARLEREEKDRVEREERERRERDEREKRDREEAERREREEWEKREREESARREREEREKREREEREKQEKEEREKQEKEEREKQEREEREKQEKEEREKQEREEREKREREDRERVELPSQPGGNDELSGSPQVIFFNHFQKFSRVLLQGLENGLLALQVPNKMRICGAFASSVLSPALSAFPQGTPPPSQPEFVNLILENMERVSSEQQKVFANVVDELGGPVKNIYEWYLNLLRIVPHVKFVEDGFFISSPGSPFRKNIHEPLNINEGAEGTIDWTYCPGVKLPESLIREIVRVEWKEEEDW
jgi:hypothetical protein